jgi:Na+/proline symporter/nitrogen-specific signal transduction histidine kinase
MTPAVAPAPAGLPAALVLGAALAWLLLLFAVAAWADRRAAQGRSVVDNAWVYTLSMGVYCTAWTYFGSVGRAASSGLGFLPIYLGPTLAMVLAWLVLRKMVRIARTLRITSIADFIASRHGRSRVLAGVVTLLALVGVLPYLALQLKAVANALAVLTGTPASAPDGGLDATLAIALVLAGFAIAFGTRQLDATERHEGLVAAIALESALKLLAFVAVGVFVCWGIFDGPGDLRQRALAVPEIARLISPPAEGGVVIDATQWFTLVLLAGFSVLLLPRQFQVMVVENMSEAHIRRAAWLFPAYLLAINVFVLPIALAGLVVFGPGAAASGAAETFVLTLPMAAGAQGLALLACIGGLSAATGMVIVEATAVATMVCNDLVLPLLLRWPRFAARDHSRTPLTIRRVVILVLLLLGWLYHRVAGEAYALVSIGLISFAAVAQFAPAFFGGMYWKGGTQAGALAGLVAGALIWLWTLLLPAVARSGWIGADFVADGAFGWAWTRPEALLGLTGLDNLSHAVFWSLLVNTALYVGISLLRPPQAAEAAQALRFVDVFEPGRDGASFWRGRARTGDLIDLVARFLGRERARAAFDAEARRLALPPHPQDDGIDDRDQADPRLVPFAETQLAGAIGSASARVMVAAVVQEERLEREDLLRVVEEASALRQLNERLQSLDKLKDDFMSSVTHELRTPLTGIRALTELMRDDPDMPAAQRQQFLDLVVAESERLSRLVNQVLDMAKIESGHADWQHTEVDLAALCEQALATTAGLFRERGATAVLHRAAAPLPRLMADPDRLLQVLINLLSNAAKFVPAGRGHVELRLLRLAAALRVEVQDNGPGIAPEQQVLVFEKFRQGGDARNRPQGTGLGLPISRRIVEHFGGTMWLRSVPGQGACFGFDLPLAGEETTR